MGQEGASAKLRGCLNQAAGACERTLSGRRGDERKGGRPANRSGRPEHQGRVTTNRAALLATATKEGGNYMGDRAAAVLSVFYSHPESIEAVPASFNPARRAPRNPEQRRGEHASVRLSREQEGGSSGRSTPRWRATQSGGLRAHLQEAAAHQEEYEARRPIALAVGGATGARATYSLGSKPGAERRPPDG